MYARVYDLWSTINVQVFFGLCRKLARTKTQQISDKASKHNGRKVFLQLSTGGVNFIFYTLSSIKFTSSLFAATYQYLTLSYQEVVGWYTTRR